MGTGWGEHLLALGVLIGREGDGREGGRVDEREGKKGIEEDEEREGK